MTAKRFMVDDAGTLIDMYTIDTFDYVSDVCDLLNKQHETIQRLKENIDELLFVNVEEELLKENEQLKQSNSQFAKVNREGIKKIQKLAKENEQLKKQVSKVEALQILIKLEEENKQLKKENKQLLCIIVEILDFIEDKKGVSIEEMGRWWKEKEKELKK